MNSIFSRFLIVINIIIAFLAEFLKTNQWRSRGESMLKIFDEHRLDLAAVPCLYIDKIKKNWASVKYGHLQWMCNYLNEFQCAIWKEKLQTLITLLLLLLQVPVIFLSSHFAERKNDLVTFLKSRPLAIVKPDFLVRLFLDLCSWFVWIYTLYVMA